jgi:hypothetical protein
VRVNDWLSRPPSEEQALTPRDALDCLVSFAIAEEGTNTLYIRLVEAMLRREEDYTLVEVELVLNYFPHAIWREDPALTRLRESFYHPLLVLFKDNVGQVSRR